MFVRWCVVQCMSIRNPLTTCVPSFSYSGADMNVTCFAKGNKGLKLKESSKSAPKSRIDTSKELPAISLIAFSLRHKKKIHEFLPGCQFSCQGSGP
jgi:hypothetical protein